MIGRKYSKNWIEWNYLLGFHFKQRTLKNTKYKGLVLENGFYKEKCKKI